MRVTVPPWIVCAFFVTTISDGKQDCRLDTRVKSSTGLDYWPWIAPLRHHGVTICLATILNRQWIVTSAYCVLDPARKVALNPMQMTFDLSSGTSSARRKIFGIDQVLVLDNYLNSTEGYDLALLKLRSRITFRKFRKSYKAACFSPYWDAYARCETRGWTDPGTGRPHHYFRPSRGCLDWYSLDCYDENLSCQSHILTMKGGPVMCNSGGEWAMMGVVGRERCAEGETSTNTKIGPFLKQISEIITDD